MLVGFRIVFYSIRQLLGNGSAALRIFLLPTMLTFAFINYFQLNCIFSGPAIDQAIRGGYFPWFATTALFVVSELLFLWCAVAWHRFVLLNEAPSLPLLPLRVGRAMAYFRRSLWTLLLALVPFLVLGVIAGLIFAVLGRQAFAPASKVYHPTIFTALSTFAIDCLVGAVFLRVLTSLPAAALGVPGSVKETWAATRSQLPTLLIISGSLLLFKHVTTWLMQAASVGTETASGAAIRVTVYWVTWMFGLSLLTTLYGYYIEKRPLT